MPELRIFFNERSRTTSENKIERLRLAIMASLSAIIKIREKRPDMIVFLDAPVADLFIETSERIFSFGEILNGDMYRDYWRILKNQRFFRVMDSTVNISVSYMGNEAIGMSGAHQHESGILSFNYAPWQEKSVAAQVIENGENIQIRNFSSQYHVESHEKFIVEYGKQPSQTACVHRNTIFWVYLYLNDHGNPHVHIWSPNGEKEYAKIRIENQDVLSQSNDVPQSVISSAKDWIVLNQDDLLLGWERCRAGQLPFTIS